MILIFISISETAANLLRGTASNTASSCGLNCSNEARVKTLEVKFEQLKQDVDVMKKNYRKRLKLLERKMQTLERKFQTQQQSVSTVAASPSALIPSSLATQASAVIETKSSNRRERRRRPIKSSTVPNDVQQQMGQFSSSFTAGTCSSPTQQYNYLQQLPDGEVVQSAVEAGKQKRRRGRRREQIACEALAESSSAPAAQSQQYDMREESRSSSYSKSSRPSKQTAIAVESSPTDRTTIESLLPARSDQKLPTNEEQLKKLLKKRLKKKLKKRLKKLRAVAPETLTTESKRLVTFSNLSPIKQNLT